MAIEDLAAKLDGLRQRLKELSPGLIAVSGGVDSRFLAHFAWTGGLHFTAVFFQGPHQSPEEIHWAKTWLAEQGRPWRVLAVDPLSDPGVAANDRERCYHCKRAVFRAGLALARALALPFVLDGSQASDTALYRPGRQALAEMGILSPLAEAGLSKQELRAAAASIGLDRPEQTARPCLLTRFAYGLAPDAGLLDRLGRAEDELARLGLKDFRLRATQKDRYTLHIQASESATWAAVQVQAGRALASLGFDAFSVAFPGKVSGYFDYASTEDR